ncbi:DUF485 domain-containing protein [Pseudomonas sp. 5P_5.1_Bac1]|uniref:DUF485 domain-containing protein n=1 Tax=Pseudomonas sp. 5P_5.1_Bac1 TaxID=2971616 RepID=UPI0021C6A6BB|nr:DUF485 domain-containing protein [Pseudomonas sp. 5P_5.1_Bac1]MCU1724223.1 DUF485 domain-containing protein [Pseudomonas sp. 5P_5.1_Bac1]
MTSSDALNMLRNHPGYQTLVQRRNRLAFSLTVIVLGCYSLFVCAVSWRPDLLLIEPAVLGLTTGIWSALVLIIGSWLLTAVYVVRANGAFDHMTQVLLTEVNV